MNVDPAASMRCWAIEVELGGRLFEVPPLTAADWWPVLISADLSTVLDLLTSSDADLDEMLLSGAISGQELSQVMTDVIEEAAGRPFMAAYILAMVAGMDWPVINGQIVQRGFRWDVMPLGAALDVIHMVVVGSMDEKTRTKFLAQLDAPAPGSSRGPDRRKMVEDFETLAGPRPTTGVTATGERSGGSRPRTRQRRPPHLPDGRSPAPTPLPAPPV